LKPSPEGPRGGQARSLPVRGRGLKLNAPTGSGKSAMSLPVRGRGLKLRPDLGGEELHKPPAPRAGAWIETTAGPGRWRQPIRYPPEHGSCEVFEAYRSCSCGSGTRTHGIESTTWESGISIPGRRRFRARKTKPRLRAIAKDPGYRCPEPLLVIIGGSPHGNGSSISVRVYPREMEPVHLEVSRSCDPGPTGDTH
jgi:hypothetical protein